MNAVVAVGGVLGGACGAAVLLLPAVLFNGLMMLTGDGISGWRSVFEGLYVSSFLYCTLLSSLKCRRLTAHSATTARSTRRFSAMKTTCRSPWKNVRKQKRFHPRCGSSFMILMLFARHHYRFFIPFSNPFSAHILCSCACRSLSASVMRLIKLCGKYDNVLTRIIAAPGLWFQRLTVKRADRQDDGSRYCGDESGLSRKTARILSDDAQRAVPRSENGA